MDSKNEVTTAKLIRCNWLRTLSITAQSAITFLMLAQVFGAAQLTACASGRRSERQFKAAASPCIRFIALQ